MNSVHPEPRPPTAIVLPEAGATRTAALRQRAAARAGLLLAEPRLEFAAGPAAEVSP